MWKYKNLLIIVSITLAFDITGILLKMFHALLNGFKIPYYYYITNCLDILCFYSAIAVLKKHDEKPWHAIPFYGFIILRVVDIIKTQTDHKSLLSGSGSAYTIYIFVAVVSFLNLILLLLSVFRIQNPLIKKYFKIYGFSWLASIVSALGWALIPFYVFSTHLFSYTWVSDLFILMPIAVLLWMQLNLYIKNELYQVGDLITTKKDIENIPFGSTGTIVKKHGSDYYEVEFTDEQGNLINTTLINADDMTHIEQQDLLTQIENFGLNSSGTLL